MIMQDFFYNLITLIFFVIALALFYAALSVVYSSVFINLVLISFSIFVLLQGCERIDKKQGLGKYANNKNKM